MSKGRPSILIRMPEEHRLDFIDLCNSHGTNASIEIRAFVERMLEKGTFDSSRLKELAREKAKA